MKPLLVFRMAQQRAICYATTMAEKETFHKRAKPVEPTLVDLENYRFDPGKKITPPVPILSLKGVALCTPGNISNIQGQAKSAKSSVLGAAMAAMLRSLTGKAEDQPEETMLFTSGLPANKDDARQVILHFDTEQSSYHHHKLAMDILKRAGIEKNEYPSLPFHSYSLVCIDLTSRRRLIQEKIDNLGKENLACLVLDGVADLISDPNNADESFDVVAWLHALADSRKCVVLTILHENPGDGGKARGHLGSQIQRKSETNLCVAKPGGKSAAISHISIERARGAHIPSDEPIEISWCDKKSRHLLHEHKREKTEADKVVAPPLAGTRLTKKEQAVHDWLKKVLGTPLSRKDFIAKVMTRNDVGSKRTAQNRLNAWAARGWIHKMPRGKQAPYALGPAPEEPEDPENSDQFPGEAKPAAEKKNPAPKKKTPKKGGAKKKAAVKKGETIKVKPAAKKSPKSKSAKKTPRKSSRKSTASSKTRKEKSAIKKLPTTTSPDLSAE